MRPVVSVTGACNGAGKTTLACAILRSFPGVFDALKMSTIYPDGPCPRSAVNDCACRQMRGPFGLIEDPATLLDPSTDTGKLHAATAGGRILWAVASDGHQEEALAAALDAFAPSRPLLIEGNSASLLCEPSVRVFVYDPGLPESRWKKNARAILDARPIVVENPNPGTGARCIPPLPGAHMPKNLCTPVHAWPDATIVQAVRATLEAAE